MFCGAGNIFVYMCLHTGALLHGIAHGALTENLVFAVVVVQVSLIFSAGFHFALWLLESSRERYPDDPECNKRSEWLCAFSVGCYFLTLPILTQCRAYEPVSQQVLEGLSLGLIGIATFGVLACFHFLNAPAPTTGGTPARQSVADPFGPQMELLPN